MGKENKTLDKSQNGNSYLGAGKGIALPKGCLDWNTLSLDQMVEHLRQKIMFTSSGDAKCIYQLIEFYDKHKV